MAKNMARWSKQDYELVAEVLKAAAGAVEVPGNPGHPAAQAEEMRLHIAEQFAYRFKQDNPRFKSHVFYQACGVFPQEDK